MSKDEYEDLQNKISNSYYNSRHHSPKLKKKIFVVPKKDRGKSISEIKMYNEVPHDFSMSHHKQSESLTFNNSLNQRATMPYMSTIMQTSSKLDPSRQHILNQFVGQMPLSIPNSFNPSTTNSYLMSPNTPQSMSMATNKLKQNMHLSRQQAMFNRTDGIRPKKNVNNISIHEDLGEQENLSFNNSML